jgi:hypothetical protein
VRRGRQGGWHQNDLDVLMAPSQTKLRPLRALGCLAYRPGGEDAAAYDSESNYNAISLAVLALGAVSFKRGHVLGGGQVPVLMFARVSQSASDCTGGCRVGNRT